MDHLSWIEVFLIVGLGAVGVALGLPLLGALSEAERQQTCANNLKQLGLALKMYANESRGEMLPPVSPVPENWIVDANALYPRYVSDLGLLACPASATYSPAAFTLTATDEHPDARVGERHPDCVSGTYYTYTGYLVLDDFEALCVADRARDASLPPVGAADIQVAPLPYGLDAYDRVSGQIPVMWDRVSLDSLALSHRRGGNVMFLGGYVEFLEYDAKNASHHFPMTRVAAELFGNAAPQLSPDCWTP